MWKLNNILLNNQWITKEIKEEIKKYLNITENQGGGPKMVEEQDGENTFSPTFSPFDQMMKRTFEY